MKHLHIICKATPLIYKEVVDAFKREFVKMGWYFTYEDAFKREEKLRFSKDVNIVIKAQRQFSPDRLPEGSFKVLFQSEQFSKLRQFNSTPHAEEWDLILDVFKHNAGHYEEVKENTIYFPIGYHSTYTWKNLKAEMVASQPDSLDFYLFGARTPYRRKIWREVVEPISKNSRFGNQDLEALKYYYIMAAKVNIFIDGWAPYHLPMMHCMQVLANGKFLVAITEDVCRDTSPYLNGEHFIQVHPSAAKSTLQKILRDDKMREEFSANMLENITKYHRFSNYMKEFIERIPK